MSENKKVAKKAEAKEQKKEEEKGCQCRYCRTGLPY